MSFYPGLYEGEELAKGKFETLIGKYVGASPANNIMIDAITRRIVHVNGKKRNESITGWEDLISFPRNHRDKLGEFIEFKGGASPAKVLDDIKWNKAKEKQAAAPRKKPLKWEPREIPVFPKGLTWGNFWDYQFDKHGDEIEEISKDDKVAEPKKTKASKAASAFETEYKIPENVSQFYIDNKKGKEWAAFLKNSTSGKGKSVVGELNALFSLISKVINGDVKSGEQYKVKKGNANVSLNNPEEVKEWKSDMIDYIGKYSNKTIKNVNTDGTYSKIVPQKGAELLGFLGVLMNSEPSGMGRGEVLMAYIMQNARFAGGSESFDITAGDIEGDEEGADIKVDDITYELKDYSDAGGSIRLGAHGALTRFKWWKEMERTVKLTRDLLDDIGPEKLKSILDTSDPRLFQVWEFIASNKSYQNNREVGSAIDAGEVNTGKLAILKVFYALMNEFLSKGDIEEKGKYTYAILKGKEVKPQTVKIDPIDSEIVKGISDIKVSFDEKDLVKFKDLGSIKYIKDPLQLQKDLDDIGRHYSETTDVDYFMVFMPDKLDIDVLDDYVFDTISQKAVKIKNINRRSEEKSEQHADKAFKKWKEQSDQPYYEIYHDMLTDKGEETNESHYPRLYDN